MDRSGVVFAGCDASSSALTFDKVATKARVKEVGVPVTDEVVFENGEIPSAEVVLEALGASVVIKPVAQGSSVGLMFAEGIEEKHFYLIEI